MPNAELLSPSLRGDLPILSRTARDGKRPVYLDFGATSQRLKQVADTEVELLTHHSAPVYRGTYEIVEEVTDVYEDAREAIAGFIGADYDELIFTKNATETLNTVASVLGDDRSGQYQVGEGGEIVVTELGHHVNLVLWQELARRAGATLCWCGVIGNGHVDIDSLELSEKTKVAAFIHQSNTTGAVADVKEMVRHIYEIGALVVPGACQSMLHMPVDAKDLDVDLLAFSGHKMLGPNGVGTLYGCRELLETLSLFSTSGSMIEVVAMEKTTLTASPQRFEVGVMITFQVADLGAVMKYLDTIGMDEVATHEYRLAALALGRLQEIDDMTIIGPTTPEQRGFTVSFKTEGIHPYDLGQILDSRGVCIRIGHHCTQLIHRVLNIQSTARASLHIYNMEGGVQALANAVCYAQKFSGITP